MNDDERRSFDESQTGPTAEPGFGLPPLPRRRLSLSPVAVTVTLLLAAVIGIGVWFYASGSDRVKMLFRTPSPDPVAQQQAPEQAMPAEPPAPPAAPVPAGVAAVEAKVREAEERVRNLRAEEARLKEQIKALQKAPSPKVRRGLDVQPPKDSRCRRPNCAVIPLPGTKGGE